MTLIDGKAISEQVKQEIAAEVAEIVARGGKRPHLAAILVGHDGGSETYVAAKVKACEVCGFKSSLIRYEADVTEEELLAKVRELNEDADVDGFIVQLPLPKHISEQKVIETIDYRKDVDGFHPINVGRMSIGLPCYVSATPNGILELLKRYQIETSGKKCVVLGRSNIVGKPMAALMMQKAYPGDATVTVCHQPAVCHRTPPVIIVVDDGKRLVIRRLRVSSYVHGPLGGIIAVNALRSQLGMLDRRMVKLLIVVHPAVKVPLRPRLTGSIAAPVVIPMAVFPLGKLPGHKGARRSRIMPQRKAVSGFKGGSFQNHISLYCLQEIPPFCASG